MAGGPAPAFRGPAKRHALSPDGKTLAIAERMGKITFLDISTWKAGATIDPGVAKATYYYSLVFSPDGKSLLTDDLEGKGIKQWDLATGRVRAVFGPLAA